MLTPEPSVDDRPRSSTQDPRWILARRIARSPTFARSEQLPKLLLYVCKMAISDRVDEINEQRIGVDVFGRSPNYDSAADGIVRSHATRLRQRLERYFSGEGADEPLRIEIPRGSYVPRFYPVAPEENAAPEVALPTEGMTEVPEIAEEHRFVEKLSQEMPSQNRWFRQRWGTALMSFLSALTIAALVVAVVHHLRRDAALAAGRAESGQTPIERQFWNSLFPENGKTFIIPGDSGLVLYETVTNREVSLSDYLGGEYRDPSFAKNVHSEASAELTSDLASRRYTSIVDLGVSEQLSHLPQWSATRAATVFARDLRPADAAASNLILIGSRQANPWVSLVEPSLNFILVPDGRRGFQFLNRHPRAGELPIYTPQDEPGNLGASNVFGQVAYLPNPGGQGMILVLCGMWMSGTQSAAKFIANSAQFSEWLKFIANTDGSIPPFELLLSTKNLQGSATYTTIIAKRVRGK